jgi:CBS domain-containing protein
VDPLERLNVGDVMTTTVRTVSAATPVTSLIEEYFLGNGPKHQGYPVVDEDCTLAGIVTKADVLDQWIKVILSGDRSDLRQSPIITYDLIRVAPITVHPDETCRSAVEKMAREGIGRLLVVSPEDPRKLVGIVTRSDLLKPRVRLAEEEERQERFLPSASSI